jgi:glucose-1-phosphate adenylyltransferase
MGRPASAVVAAACGSLAFAKREYLDASAAMVWSGIVREVGLVRNVVAVILGGGQGTRLFPLTSIRSKPAVPLAGKYRLIDIPISNCINSEINRIYVLTQFMSVSLHNHIRNTYLFDHFSGGFVSVLAAQETYKAGRDWFQGTADAVRKNLDYIQQEGIDFVLILSGDQLYRMDYRQLIDTHERTRADVTIACMPVSRDAARSFGIMRGDASGRVLGFLEKPQTEEELQHVRTDPAWIEGRNIPARGRDLLASMGIYVFNRQTLVDVLSKTNYADFGREVFPAAVRSRNVQMHLFDGYWEDIGTIRSFYEANLSLAGDHPPLLLSAPDAPIYSRPRFLPSTRFGDARIKSSLIADGCRIGNGVVIENSVIGLRCIIDDNVVIRDSIVMGADFYERRSPHRANEAPALGIAAGAHLDGVIVDKNCSIGRGVRIANDRQLDQAESLDGLCYIRDRIPIIVKGSTLPHGWQIRLPQAVAV